jgi:hypothetical protein
MVGDKYYPIRCIDFWFGGIDIVCADSIDDRGDLNLNGLANEIADAVLYTNYFLYGMASLDPNPQFREAQIAASDVNADGTPLTVGDLVYLIRIITGDALPFAKLTQFKQDINVHYNGETLSTESPTDIGAILMTFAVNAAYAVENLTDMTLKQSEADGKLRVLVYDISQKSIAAGLSDVVNVKGDAQLISVEAADFYGNLLAAKLDGSILPSQFELSQNYPNPFNPETVIGIALPTATEVTLKVFNMAGQTVATIVNGTMSAGYHQLRWNGKDASGADASSGVYLYKITAGGFTETRKMLLVK